MGKGLAALLKDNTDINSAKDAHADEVVGNVNEIPIDRIEANPDQPRTLFDPEALEELSISIKELGIIQPITVRKNGDKFQIISGERRYRAAKLAGLDSVPVFVRLADDQTMLEMALVENIQREELDPIEIALSYQRLIEECELTQEAMSDRVGKKRSTITNYLRLLKLQPLIQAGLRDKMIAMGHARALINVEQEEDQLKLYQEIIGKELSVRQVEEAVRKLKTGKTSSATKAPKLLSPELQEAQNRLSEQFSAKVELSRSKRGRGKISISFKDDYELKRILEMLKN